MPYLMGVTHGASRPSQEDGAVSTTGGGGGRGVKVEGEGVVVGDLGRLEGDGLEKVEGKEGSRWGGRFLRRMDEGGQDKEDGVVGDVG